MDLSSGRWIGGAHVTSYPTTGPNGVAGKSRTRGNKVEKRLYRSTWRKLVGRSRCEWLYPNLGLATFPAQNAAIASGVAVGAILAPSSAG